jgi:hypothetical protein
VEAPERRLLSLQPSRRFFWAPLKTLVKRGHWHMDDGDTMGVHYRMAAEACDGTESIYLSTARS